MAALQAFHSMAALDPKPDSVAYMCLGVGALGGDRQLLERNTLAEDPPQIVQGMAPVAMD